MPVMSKQIHNFKEDLDNFAQNVIRAMHTYQKLHKTKAQCGTNCQFLCDCLNANYPGANAHAVSTIAYSVKDNTVITHIVVKVGNMLYDPSYETFSLKDVRYFRNVKHLKNWFNEILLTENGVDLDPLESIKYIIKQMIKLTKFAERINDRETVSVACKKYYDRQADFLEGFNF